MRSCKLNNVLQYSQRSASPSALRFATCRGGKNLTNRPADTEFVSRTLSEPLSRPGNARICIRGISRFLGLRQAPLHTDRGFFSTTATDASGHFCLALNFFVGKPPKAKSE